MSRPQLTTTDRPLKTPQMLIGALLRVPAQAIQRRIIKELNAAGYDELRVPHMAVLQFPGPDGVRPGALAERAGMSKQAMNQLLRSLESLGYISRSDAPDEGRARIVRLTRRGRVAYSRAQGNARKRTPAVETISQEQSLRHSVAGILASLDYTETHESVLRL